MVNAYTVEADDAQAAFEEISSMINGRLLEILSAYSAVTMNLWRRGWPST
jgi:hypothetical protein